MRRSRQEVRKVGDAIIAYLNDPSNERLLEKMGYIYVTSLVTEELEDLTKTEHSQILAPMLREQGYGSEYFRLDHTGNPTPIIQIKIWELV